MFSRSRVAPEPADRRSSRMGTALFWLIATTASFLLAECYGTILPIPFKLQQFAYAQVESPYRRRVLVEWVYRAVLHLTHGRGYTGGHSHIRVEAMTDMAIAFVSLLVTVAVARKLVARFLGADSPMRWLSLLVLYMAAVHQFINPIIRVQFPYDLPGMAFFGAGTYAALTRNRWLFYPVLILGTMNRETCMFLPPVLFLCMLREDVPLIQAMRQAPWWRYMELVAGMGAWWAVVRFCEFLTGGHGSGMQVNLRSNLRMMLFPLHWPLLAAVFGYLWIPCVLHWCRIRNVALRRIALLLPLWYAVMFVVGDVVEIRIHSEWIVYVTLCVAMVADRSLVFRGGDTTGERAANPALEVSEAG